MKIAVLAAAATFILTAGASAQNNGEIVLNAGPAINCLSGTHLTGFNAFTWTLGGTDAFPGSGSGGSASKTTLSDLTITRNVDVCSEALLKNFMAGKSYPTLTLTQYEGTGVQGATPYMIVTLSNVIINGYGVGGSNSTAPAETISFGYSKVCVETFPRTASGATGQPVSVCYNAATNTTN